MFSLRRFGAALSSLVLVSLLWPEAPAAARTATTITTDLNYAVTTFNTSVWNPYMRGMFNPAEPRLSTPAIAAATAAAARARHALVMAGALEQSDPALRVLVPPTVAVINKLGALGANLRRGNLADTVATDYTFAVLVRDARRHGLRMTRVSRATVAYRGIQ